jgi:hypothetical protein
VAESYSKLLLEDNPIPLLPRLAVKVGLNKALVLQQVHYWLKHYEERQDQTHWHRGQWWVWNSYEQWRDDNFPWWSVKTVQRTFTDLRNEELLIATSVFNKKGYDRTLWYTIDYRKLGAIVSLKQNSS